MKRGIKLFSVMLAFVMAFGMVLADTAAVSAGSSWDLTISPTVYVGEPWAGLEVYNIKTDKSATVISLTSSAPKVIKIRKNKGEGENGEVVYDFEAVPKKAGKAKLTGKFRMSNGKTGSFSKTVVVKKYPGQIKSLKVNGKSIDLKKNKYNYYLEGFTGNNVTIKMNLKKGWKITSAEGSLDNFDTGKSKQIKNAKKLLKSGKTISFPQSYNSFWISITMEKGDDMLSYGIQLRRPIEETDDASADETPVVETVAE